jgi:hypothetical protein
VLDIVGEVREINPSALGPIETLEFIRSKVCATVGDNAMGNAKSEYDSFHENYFSRRV